MTGARAARVWDVVVVGAGPAGALAAYEIARAGLRVLIVERSQLPRDKVCGCCLSARGIDTLASCGLSRHLSSLAPASYRALRLGVGGHEARLPLPGGVTISRARLDAMIVDAAASAGADVLGGTRARLDPLPSSIAGTRTLQLLQSGSRTMGRVRARVVIEATGLAHPLAIDELGGEVVHQSSRIGVSAMLDADARVPWTDGDINMAVGREGYVGAVRLEDARWRIAAALDAHVVRAAGHVTPVARRVLERAGWSSPRALESATWRGSPALWRGPRGVASSRLLVIGDAAGYVEPFTGEGIACALAAGRAVAALAPSAVEHWSDDLVDLWTNAMRRRIQRGWRAATVAAHALRQPALATAATAVLARYPALASPAVTYVSGTSEGGPL